MATVERTFQINAELAKELDKMIGLEAQSRYINALLSENIQRHNVDKLNTMIENFRFNYPKNDGISSTDLLRQIRDGEIR